LTFSRCGALVQIAHFVANDPDGGDYDEECATNAWARIGQ